MTFLAGEWKLASDDERDGWKAYEPQTDLPPYNKYLQYNFKQLKHFQGLEVWPDYTPQCPSINWPPNLALNSASHAPLVPVPGPGTATFGFNITTLRENWLVLWFHTYFIGPWCRYPALIGVTKTTSTGNHWVTFTDLPAEVFRTGYLCVSRGGKPRLNAIYRQTTPT